MGYTTEFVGSIKITPPLTYKQGKTLLDINDDLPSGRPGCYCQWVPNEDGNALVWDGNEKFYNYVEWLNFLNDNYFSKWSCTLSGKIQYQGEEVGDSGWVVIDKDGRAQKIAAEDPSEGKQFTFKEGDRALLLCIKDEMHRASSDVLELIDRLIAAVDQD